jgi:two-component system LytT family response regulator
MAADVKSAIGLINTLKPQLIFLDIALPDGDGFNVLEAIRHSNYKVIFVTAYDRYAIRAFEFAALHYLLKPVSVTDLQEAVNRYGEPIAGTWEKYQQHIQTLRSNLNSQQQKIMLPTALGYELVDLDDITHLEANHNYTQCYFRDGTQLLVSKSLINFESILSDSDFVRIHNQYIVNLKYVRRYVRGSGGSVKLIDGSELNVSKSRKSEFLDRLSGYARHL